MIAASIAGFVVFIVPHYGAIGELRVQKEDYNTILANARKLQEQRDALVKKYNAFTSDQLSQLNTMLPTNPENVKLILELDAIASQNNMILQNVKIEDPNTQASTTLRPGAPAANTDIGTLTITFSVAGPYNSFTSFLKSIEKSLRVVDIQKISFSATDPKTQNYQYTVAIKTYWLK